MDLTFKNLLDIIFKRLIMIILITATCGVGTYLIQRVTSEDVYTPSASFYINTSGENTAQDINYAKMVVDTFIVILESNAFYENVATEINEDTEFLDAMAAFYERDNYTMTPRRLRGMISIRQIASTETIRVTTTSSSALEALKIVTVISELANEFVQENTTTKAQISVFDPAPNNVNMLSPVPTSRTLYIVIGAFIGFILSIFIAIAVESLDIRVNEESKILERFNVNILGSIPDWKDALEYNDDKKYKDNEVTL